SCPDTQLTSLLEWNEYWRSVLTEHDYHYLPAPTEEFYRRSAGGEIRRKEMVAALRRNLALLHCHDVIKREFSHRVAWGLWLRLLQDVAVENPGVETQPTDTEQWIVWFHHTLSSAPFAQLGAF